MELLNTTLKQIFLKAFRDAGYDDDVTVGECAIANFGDFQCQTPLLLAKKYHKSPLAIANDVVAHIDGEGIIKNITVASPGYINFFIDGEYLAKYLQEYLLDVVDTRNSTGKKVLIDYGGANCAKPLHVGHLRSADIGESIKRIAKYMGDDCIGDVHLGDWGLQMGMVIYAVWEKNPNLVYFDENYTGEYPSQPPFTMDELKVMYPNISQRAKTDEVLHEKVKKITYDLQQGRRGYVALWKQIIEVSKKSIKQDYDKLNAHFDLWLGESDSKNYQDEVVDYVIKNGYSRVSDGATIVDVAQEGDKTEIPPFMLLNSAGSALYSTTELATIVQRDREFGVDKILYVVDNRQELHFVQVFRCVKKINILKKDIDLQFVGFGTMNGPDGKPYKTRDGKAMGLDDLMQMVLDKALEKVKQSKPDYSDTEIENISKVVAISALKFADLSVLRTKDLVFDVDKFCSFEGKTGPYILYTITRANSVLAKADDCDAKFSLSDEDKRLALCLIKFTDSVISAYEKNAPSFLCDYAYSLANEFNTFYGKSSIIYEKDSTKKHTKIMLTKFTKNMLQKCMDLLAINTLEKM